MRNIVSFLVVFLVLSATNQKPEIVLNAKLLRSFDSIDYQKHKQKYYDISLTIKNKSNKRVAFWLWTCSWDENFRVNNHYINFDSWACDNNSPWIFRLNPNDSLIRIAKFYKVSYKEYPEIKTTKFGLIYIDTIKCPEFSDYDQFIDVKSKYDKIIWSNSLNLSK